MGIALDVDARLRKAQRGTAQSGLIAGGGRQGQADREGGAGVFGARDVDGSAVGVHEVADDGPAQAAAAGLPVAGRVGPVEAVEDVGEMLGSDDDAGGGGRALSFGWRATSASAGRER